MSNWFQLFILLSIFILGARALERVVSRAGLPGILGELLFGVALGAFVAVPEGEVVHFLTYMGAIAFTFILGMETDVDALLHARRETAVSAASLALVLAPSYLALRGLGVNLRTSLLALAAISSTCISASLGDLVTMGLHSGPAWSLHRASAVLDELVALALIILALGSWPGAFLDVSLFLVLSITLGHLSERGLNRFFKEHPYHLRWLEGLLIGVLMLFAALGDLFLGSAVEASFILGLILGRGGIHDQFVEDVEFTAYSFFVPILTVYLGTTLFSSWRLGPILWTLLIASVLGRPMATMALSRASGYGPRESLLLGLADMPHLEVPLVALWVHLHALGHQGEFATAVILTVALSTTIGVLSLRILQNRV